MSSEPSLSLGRLARAARHAEYRLRLNAGLRSLATLLPLPLTLAGAALAYGKLADPSPAVVRALVYAVALTFVVPLLGMLAAAFARRPRLVGALTLDRHYDTADRITNALSFAELPERTAMMEAAMRDALRRVERPSARRAVPLSLPRDLWVSVGLALLVVVLAKVEPRRAEGVIGAAPPAPESILLAADDIELLEEELEPFAEAAARDPEVAAAVRELNQLLEDIAERRVDRAEVFRRAAAIEQAMFRGADAEGKALDEALTALAQALKDSRLTAPTAEALEQGRLDDAEQALRKLAERLKDPKSPSQEELERLRKALEAAAKSSSERVNKLEERRRELEEQHKRLLNKKKKNETPEERARAQNEIEQSRRRLERLERERKQAAQASQAMSELDRQLAKAAEELMRELGESARQLEEGAESMNRMAQKQMTDAQKQALKERLEQLRELLRQGGPGREKHLERLRRFGRRARGQQGGEQEQAGQQGQPGQPSAEGTPRGPGGVERIDVPVPGAGRPSAAGQPSAGSDSSSSQKEPWGHGTNDALKGKATDLEGQTEDVAAAAVDTGQGTASSEVVYGAAERGFSSRGYRDVYTQYRTVMEDALSKDEIPAGYEFYVRRYFQLIRPREAP